jgi:transcriptional regulator with XRE-family HTH domain
MRSATFNGPRLLALREEAELTQTELAGKLGKLLGRTVHTATISKYENGKQQPSPKTLGAICEALEVRKAELLVVPRDQAA